MEAKGNVEIMNYFTIPNSPENCCCEMLALAGGWEGRHVHDGFQKFTALQGVTTYKGDKFVRWMFT